MVNNKLIYRLAKEAGMPGQTLDTYSQYIVNLDIRFPNAKNSEKHIKTNLLFPKDAPFP